MTEEKPISKWKRANLLVLVLGTALLLHASLVAEADFKPTIVRGREPIIEDLEQSNADYISVRTPVPHSRTQYRMYRLDMSYAEGVESLAHDARLAGFLISGDQGSSTFQAIRKTSGREIKMKVVRESDNSLFLHLTEIHHPTGFEVASSWVRRQLIALRWR